MKHKIQDRDIIEGKFWIWGAKEHGENFCGMLDFLKIDMKEHVLGVIDSDIKKQGKYFHGIQVYNPHDLIVKAAFTEDDVIIVCASEKVTPVIASVIAENFPSARFAPYSEIVFDHGRDFSRFYGDFMSIGDDCRIISRCCRRDDWDREAFISIQKELGIYASNTHIRKTWEFAYIVEALLNAGKLAAGKRGIGFAVGDEILPSYFASLGIDVMASDLSSNDERAALWINTRQNVGGNIDKLWHPRFCSRKIFEKHVKYRDIDMNHIPNDENSYDFCWSTCAIEHVGSLNLSIEFMKNVMDVLKPGGIAVHTTEFNLSSNDETIQTGQTVLWRKQDVEALQKWMLEHGHKMEVTFDRGNMPADYYVEMSPFSEGIEDLICLYCLGYISTGFAFIVQKAES